MDDAVIGAGATWILDLDGVVWLDDQPIPGAAAAIAQLRSIGTRVAFVTNNSFAARADHLAKFARHGIEVDDDDLVTSAQAAAGLLKPGERAIVLGGRGINEALLARGVEIVEDPKDLVADAVVVGLDRDLTYDRLTRAVRAVLGGARLLATNDDATYPTPDGPLPGGGSMLSAVAYAAKATSIVAGKPHGPAADLARERLGRIDVMVGDRPETDGLFAVRLDARYALVRSGVTAPGATPAEPKADYDFADLRSLVEALA